MQLEEIRHRIDDVDAKLCALLVERFDLAKEVALAKKESGIKIENKEREKVVIEQIRSKMPDDLKDYAEQVFRLLIVQAKDLQSKI